MRHHRKVLSFTIKNNPQYSLHTFYFEQQNDSFQIGLMLSKQVQMLELGDKI